MLLKYLRVCSLRREARGPGGLGTTPEASLAAGVSFHDPVRDIWELPTMLEGVPPTN